MKLLVDIEKLEADGRITPAQAKEIRGVAAAETMSLAVNVLCTLGIIAIVVGVLYLNPSDLALAIVGAAMVAVGIGLSRYKAGDFGFLGNAFVVIGVLFHCVAVLTVWKSSPLASAYTTVVTLALGIVLRHGFLVALSVFALAGLLGSSTGYSRATYTLWVREASFTIVAFGVLAVASFWISRHVGAAYRRLARIFGVLALIWVNFGFWVGSLWGDYPGASWVRAELLYGAGVRDRAAKLRAWYEQAFHIPDTVFVVAWAALLIAVGIWAAMRNQRAVVNTVATFGAIHFYTQWFERLRSSPEVIIGAGVIAVAIAYALWRYNRTTPAAPGANARQPSGAKD